MKLSWLLKGTGAVGIFLLIAGPVLGMFCWTYSLNTWLVFAHKEPIVVWWHGLLLGCVPGIGQLNLLAAAITWICMLFLK